MKRVLAVVLALLMLWTASGVLAEKAEEGKLEPLYATVGEALEDSREGRVIAGGVPGEYFAVVTEKDGKFYRSVAYCDEKLTELEDVVNNLDYEAPDFFEKFDEANAAADAYRSTLPIAYSEEFTAVPLTDEELAANVGKTLAQLTSEGFEIGSNGTEPGEGDELLIVYLMRYGVYDYNCVVDVDFDTYINLQGTDAEGSLVVKSMSLAGVTESGFDKRFHTDGTVDEQEDPMAELNDIISEFVKLIQQAGNGEEPDLEALAAEMKERHPDYAELIDMYVMMYKSFGAEELEKMLTPAE